MKKLLLLLLLFGALNVKAQNEVVVLGAGTRTCSQLLDDVRNSSEQDKEVILLAYATWVQGYLSGRNKQLDSLGYKRIDLANLTKLSELLVISCKDAVNQGYGIITVDLVIDKLFDKFYVKKTRK